MSRILEHPVLGRLARTMLAVVLLPYRIARKLLRSARFWTLFLLLLIGVIVAYYVVADRQTPFTTDAYVQAFTVQVAPRVEGQVVRVHVRENQAVKKGDVLFEIDRRPFDHRIELLVAKRAQAVQQVAQLESERLAAKSEDDRLLAEEAYARSVYEQEKEIFKQAATTDRKYQDATQKFNAARAALERSRSQVRKAEQALAAKVGPEHALVAEVDAQLAEAKLNLEWTKVYSPANGYVTNVQLREGCYVHVGTPVLACVDDEQWCVVANFHERSLERLQSGQPCLVAFQSTPGRLWRGQVQSVGWGVSQGQGVPSGLLPDVKNQTSWLPPPQRFQVRVSLDDHSGVPLRVGMTASVSVYTTPEGSLTKLTQRIHQLVAWFYYL